MKNSEPVQQKFKNGGYSISTAEEEAPKGGTLPSLAFFIDFTSLSPPSEIPGRLFPCLFPRRPEKGKRKAPRGKQGAFCWMDSRL